MKILIVAYSFPPENIIGAVRVGKFAKYLHEHRHEVRVIAAPPGPDRSLPLEIPADRVLYAEDRDATARFDRLIALFRRTLRVAAADARSNAAAGVAASSGSAENHGLVELFRWHYYALLRVPDSRAGWRGNAVSVGCDLLATWRPDLIFASAPPTTSLFVAAALSKRFRIPWIAELRDLWVDNPYYPFPAWRRAIDRILERRLLEQAAMLVTVTPPWGCTLESNYDKPVAVILNGYTEEDHPATKADGAKPPGVLSVVYTGNIYLGFRDPSALFAAIGRLAPKDRAAIVVDFYGSSVGKVNALVHSYGVSDCVRVHGAVKYGESLQLQQKADVLLLLQWNDPRDAGNIPAKFFEYVAAGRPVLMHGYENGILAHMIRDRNAGLVSNEPEIIADRLAAWIATRRTGGVPGLGASAKAGLSRREQFQKLEALLANLVQSAPAHAT